MAQIRINKVLRELNISLDRAVDFLESKGIEIEKSPNTKISQEIYDTLSDEFQTDASKREKAQEVSEAKLKEKEKLREQREREIEEKEKTERAAEAKAAEDAAAAKAESDKYLADNAAREGVTVTDSGLQFEVLTDAEGDKPSAADTVTVHYKGTLTDGSTFDSSYDRGEPATFPLNRVIPGWTEGVQLMSKGAKYKFFIPSELGYGENGAGSIPPNSILVFEVELIDIEKADAPAEETPAS